MNTMYETGKLAQVSAEMRRYNLHILFELARADGQDQAGVEPIQERRCYAVAETTINIVRESPTSRGKEWGSALLNGSR